MIYIKIIIALKAFLTPAASYIYSTFNLTFFRYKKFNILRDFIYFFLFYKFNILNRIFFSPENAKESANVRTYTYPRRSRSIHKHSLISR